MTMAVSHSDDPAFLAALKEHIAASESSRLARSITKLVLLYWDIGASHCGEAEATGCDDNVV